MASLWDSDPQPFLKIRELNSLQRLYLLSQLRKQGLSDECVAVVYDAIVLTE